MNTALHQPSPHHRPWSRLRLIGPYLRKASFGFAGLLIVVGLLLVGCGTSTTSSTTSGNSSAKPASSFAGLVDIQPRLAPVYLALRDAAATDPDSAATWREISERRARNMRAFAADLRATGELRTDLSDDDIADIVWSMNGPEYWTLLVTDRGWSPEQFGRHLTDAWQRLFLA